MKLSKALRYSSVVLGHLASQPPNTFVTGKTISREYHIPSEFLLKILQQLTRAGILKSKHGISGGYALVKEPDKITLLEIIEEIEGSLSYSLGLAEQTSNEKFALKMEKVIKRAISEHNKVLEETKLADMISGLKER